jgi:hypothetical protein
MRRITFFLVALQTFLYLQDLIGQSNSGVGKWYNHSSMALNFIGHGSVFSITADHTRILSDRFSMTASTGFGVGRQAFYTTTYDDKNCFFDKSEGKETFLTIPLGLTINYGKKNTKLEFGMGSTVNFSGLRPVVFYPILGIKGYSKSRSVYYRVTTSYPIGGFEKSIPIIFSPIAFSAAYIFSTNK